MDHPLSTDVVTDGLAPRDVTLSPNGHHVACTLAPLSQSTPRPTTTLWITDVDGTAPRTLTDGTFAVHRPRWSPDGRLYFLTDRPDPLARRTHRPPLAPGLHRIEADGTGHRALTDPRATVVDHLPLPDKTTVALVVADPEPPDDAPREWGRHRPHHRLALLDLPSGAMRTITGLGERHVLHIAARPDGAHLAVITHPTPERDPVHPHWRLHLVDLADGHVDHLGDLGWEAHAPTWWHDGRRWHLSYLAMRPGPDGAQAVLDLIPGTGAEPTDLTADLERCPLELVQAAQGPPLALFAHGLDTELHRLDPSTRTFTPLRRSTGLVESLACDDTGTTVAVQVATPAHPREVYAGAATTALTRLTHLRPELEDLAWGAQERLAYRARDGLELDGLLVMPVGLEPEEGPFPMVTWVHGGPYGRFADQFTLNAHAPAQWLAHSGYAVFLPNPRGGQGHGRAFAERVIGHLGAGEWTDILDGIDLLVQRGVADPDRLGIGGWSHGGTMAAWAVGHTDRFRAALVGAGVSDWGMLAATGEYGAAEAGLSGSIGWEGIGPHPHDAVGPISFASRITAPVLIAHGREDTNVPVGQALYLHRALRHFGVECEFVTYPGAGHGLHTPSHQADLLERTRAWFDRHLRPRA